MSSQARDWGFPFMIFGVSPPGPEVRHAFVPVPDQQVLLLAHKMSKKLVEPLPEVPPATAAKVQPGDVLMPPPIWAQLDVPGHQPLHGKIERFSQTAATATWIHHMTMEVATGRRNGQVQAVSLYLTGVDQRADNCAISTCRQLRFGPGNVLPVTPEAWDKILHESRPLAVQIFCQHLARVDPSIQCAFLALGAAFFGTLGVEGDETTP